MENSKFHVRLHWGLSFDPTVLTKEREKKKRIEKWIIITLIFSTISIRNYRVYSLLYFKHKIHHEFYFHERVKERDFEYIRLITKIVKYCLLLKYPLFFKIFFYLKYINFLFIFSISTLKLLKNIKKNNFKQK